MPLGYNLTGIPYRENLVLCRSATTIPVYRTAKTSYCAVGLQPYRYTVPQKPRIVPLGYNHTGIPYREKLVLCRSATTIPVYRTAKTSYCAARYNHTGIPYHEKLADTKAYWYVGIIVQLRSTVTSTGCLTFICPSKFSKYAKTIRLHISLQEKMLLLFLSGGRTAIFRFNLKLSPKGLALPSRNCKFLHC